MHPPGLTEGNGRDQTPANFAISTTLHIGLPCCSRDYHLTFSSDEQESISRCYIDCPNTFQTTAFFVYVGYYDTNPAKGCILLQHNYCFSLWLSKLSLRKYYHHMLLYTLHLKSLNQFKIANSYVWNLKIHGALNTFLCRWFVPIICISKIPIVTAYRHAWQAVWSHRIFQTSPLRCYLGIVWIQESISLLPNWHLNSVIGEEAVKNYKFSKSQVANDNFKHHDLYMLLNFS